MKAKLIKVLMALVVSSTIITNVGLEAVCAKEELVGVVQKEEAKVKNVEDIIQEEETGVIPYEYWEECKPLILNVCEELGVEDIKEVTFEEIKGIKRIYLANEGLTGLPKIIEKFTGLEQLYIHGNKFEKIPEEIYKLKNLHSLILSNNDMITEIPKDIANLSNLKSLIISNKNLTNISEEIKSLSSLKELIINGNKNISGQLEKIFNINSLERLSLDSCNLVDLGDDISKLKNLKWLSIKDNQFTSNPVLPGVQIDSWRNLIPRVYENKQLILSSSELNITKGNTVSQDMLRGLLLVDKSGMGYQEKTEMLNSGHDIELVLDDKIISLEELKNLTPGKYKARLKLAVAELENTTAITKDYIDITITEKDEAGDSKNNDLVKTGDVGSISNLFAVGSIAGGATLLLKKKK
ncbi:leucine-rich repeat domain-containing protein [Clostridium sp. LP20]|uniref:leucine-rich repeat domain-containing protein n=1 Tax=Clostridium sp. LP20 TaxID=3418665 RepID=UPI003EE7D5D4